MKAAVAAAKSVANLREWKATNDPVLIFRPILATIVSDPHFSLTDGAQRAFTARKSCFAGLFLEPQSAL
jgi:hypothetical protein